MKLVFIADNNGAECIRLVFIVCNINKARINLPLYWLELNGSYQDFRRSFPFKVWPLLRNATQNVRDTSGPKGTLMRCICQ